MIEVTVKDFLSSKVDIPVLLEVPKNPSQRMIILKKTGGTRRNLIQSSIFAIQSYAPTKYEAAEINEVVKRLMLDGNDGIVTLNNIVSVSLNSDYDFTDTSSKRYRYQAVFDITHYEGGENE